MKLILLITILAMTNLPAQTFVPPPVPAIPTPMAAPAPTHVRERQKASRFKVTCPDGVVFSKLPATLVVTNGSITTNGGNIIQRTLTFTCPVHGDEFTAYNTTFVPVIIAVDADEVNPLPSAPTPAGGGASIWPNPNFPGVLSPGAWTTNAEANGVSVLPDTNAPVVTNIAIRTAMTDFTNQVPVAYNLLPIRFYFLDAETGQQVNKGFNLRFQAQSNYFYTIWVSSLVSPHESDWREYPSNRQLHPARGDFLAGIAVPLYDTNRFYAVRAFNGGNRATWNLWNL